ncbi:bifunctional DNA primase/polymerase [Congregibacter brevis]|uniref:Bifunctional DNA primase/polymerase n=1 Tax=Congregibacter brevis TaxID=3081201 RepID=A0ABZ0IB52_9GAMM|nr:bifunctional DNA primase/polymerase [Congregibacter sp. IMCC45268]
MGEVLPIKYCDGLDELVDAGARLIPLKGKRPVKKAWTEAKLYRADTARQWLQKGQNVGMVTGNDSGVVVIDIDPRNGGDLSLYELQETIGALPETRTVVTGGGGLHFYFKCYEGAESRKPFDGIDFQAEKRCVAIPPSVHPETGVLYEWGNNHDIAELPESWREAMNGQNAMQTKFSDDGGAIPEGKRNQTLFDIARLLFKRGDPESLVRCRIEEANTERCQPPLQPPEIALIVASAYQYRGGEASPLSRLQAAVWRWPLPSIHKLTLLSLASYADTQSLKAYPTQGQIAVRAGITDRRVRAVLKELEAQNWFSRSTHRRSQGPGFNHSYQLRVPEVTQ